MLTHLLQQKILRFSIKYLSLHVILLFHFLVFFQLNLNNCSWIIKLRPFFDLVIHFNIIINMNNAIPQARWIACVFKLALFGVAVLHSHTISIAGSCYVNRHTRSRKHWHMTTIYTQYLMLKTQKQSNIPSVVFYSKWRWKYKLVKVSEINENFRQNVPEKNRIFAKIVRQYCVA